LFLKIEAPFPPRSIAPLHSLQVASGLGLDSQQPRAYADPKPQPRGYDASADDRYSFHCCLLRKSTTKKRRKRRKNQKNLRALRFFVVDFHFVLGVAHCDLNDASENCL
jgi:hypothetical protein